MENTDTNIKLKTTVRLWYVMSAHKDGGYHSDESYTCVSDDTSSYDQVSCWTEGFLGRKLKVGDIFQEVCTYSLFSSESKIPEKFEKIVERERYRYAEREKHANTQKQCLSIIKT